MILIYQLKQFTIDLRNYLPRSFFKLISEGGSESMGTLINV